ncbi:hypothetical protein [Bradyrhizobium manausense]|nr:hypothetical protein [Bradyrhizobium manausense]
MVVLDEHANLIQNYMTTDHEIFLAYDCGKGPGRRLIRPDNPYAGGFYALRDAIGEMMQERTIRAYHYTRMTDSEIAILHRDGVHLSTPTTLRARLDALVAAGNLSAEASSILYDASPFHSEQLQSRSNKFWMVSHPIATDDSGVIPLMSHWGGEVASMRMRDRVRLAELAKIGTARVLELAVPLSLTNHSHAAGKAVVATYGRIRGCIPDKSAFDLYAQQRLQPDAILAVHSETDPSFTQIGRGYPTDFVDVDIGRWKELTGEDD